MALPTTYAAPPAGTTYVNGQAILPVGWAEIAPGVYVQGWNSMSSAERSALSTIYSNANDAAKQRRLTELGFAEEAAAYDQYSSNRSGIATPTETDSGPSGAPSRGYASYGVPRPRRGGRYDPRSQSPDRRSRPPGQTPPKGGPLGNNPGTWDPAPPPLPGGGITPNPPGSGGNSDDDELDRNLEYIFREFLRQYGLPESLWPKIRRWIIDGAGYDEILFKLRETPEYRTAFPEYFARLEAGHKALSESEILSLRDTYKQIGRFYGYSPKDQDITNAIVNDISSSEMNQRFGLYKQIEESSPWLRRVLEQESGEGITDDDIFDFMNPSIQTPRLDRFFRNAVTKQRALFNEGGGGDPRLQLLNPEERKRAQAG